MFGRRNRVLFSQQTASVYTSNYFTPSWGSLLFVAIACKGVEGTIPNNLTSSAANAFIFVSMASSGIRENETTVWTFLANGPSYSVPQTLTFDMSGEGSQPAEVQMFVQQMTDVDSIRQYATASGADSVVTVTLPDPVLSGNSCLQVSALCRGGFVIGPTGGWTDDYSREGWMGISISMQDNGTETRQVIPSQDTTVPVYLLPEPPPQPEVQMYWNAVLVEFQRTGPG